MPDKTKDSVQNVQNGDAVRNQIKGSQDGLALVPSGKEQVLPSAHESSDLIILDVEKEDPAPSSNSVCGLFNLLQCKNQNLSNSCIGSVSHTESRYYIFIIMYVRMFVIKTSPTVPACMPHSVFCYQDGGDVLTCNGRPMNCGTASASSDTKVQYVYDIYYTHSNSIDFRGLEHDLVVECSTDDGILWGNVSDDEDSVLLYDDEDDENDEDNWRNDYPDEDTMYQFDEAEVDSDPEAPSDYVPNMFIDRLKIKGNYTCLVSIACGIQENPFIFQ